MRKRELQEQINALQSRVKQLEQVKTLEEAARLTCEYEATAAGDEDA